MNWRGGAVCSSDVGASGRRGVCAAGVECMYTIGVEYGTESGRVLLVDTRDGREAATAVHRYTNGVIDRHLPGSEIPLSPDWALQDPHDYLEVLRQAIPAVLRESGVPADQITGSGIDFTACTMLPVKAGGTPLCFLDRWRARPHAWGQAVETSCRGGHGQAPGSGRVSYPGESGNL